MEWKPTVTADTDASGPGAGPLPPREPPRLPGERLLRRRAPMPGTVAGVAARSVQNRTIEE